MQLTRSRNEFLDRLPLGASVADDTTSPLIYRRNGIITSSRSKNKSNQN